MVQRYRNQINEAATPAAFGRNYVDLGEALIKSSPYLTPMDAKKLRASITPKAEIYRRQEAVDELVQRFGPGQEQEGLAWVRANKSGEEEERLASAYKQRIGEMTVREVNADAELRKQQAANFIEFYKRTWGMGQPPSLEEATQAMMSGKISTAHHEKIMRWLEVDHSRAGIEKELSASPGWYDLTPQQQEESIRSCILAVFWASRSIHMMWPWLALAKSIMSRAAPGHIFSYLAISSGRGKGPS